MNVSRDPLSGPPGAWLAWLLSVAGHALLLGVALYLVRSFHAAPPERPERLVYVEPAPPPPGGDAGADAASRPEPVQEAPLPEAVELAKVEKPVPTARRTPRPTARVAHRTPTQAALAQAEPTRVSQPPGEAAGVAGGFAGGKPGGTIGGHGDAPIAAEIAASPPLVVSRVLPEYPAAARAQHVEGQVLLRAVVDRSGRVEPHIEVERSVALLDDAAIAALRQWQFTPGRDRDGRTVRVQIEVPMRFQLR